MEAEILKSNKGKDKLEYLGYHYHLDRSLRETFNWSWAYRKSHSCKGRIITPLKGGRHLIIKGPSFHSHDPLAFEREVNIANRKIKERAASTSTNPSRLIRDVTVETDAYCRVHLPSKIGQKIKISRLRVNCVHEPNTLVEIDIPKNLGSLEGELFVLS